MPPPVVSARALSKSFPTKHVLHDISVDVEPGDIVGVLGKNGAGKTTLLELLLGFGIPTSGTAEVFGPRDLRVPDALTSRVDGSRATVVATHWTSERTAAVAAQLDADLEVESLALEDIFLELHR